MKRLILIVVPNPESKHTGLSVDCELAEALNDPFEYEELSGNAQGEYPFWTVFLPNPLPQPRRPRS
jgi:hypothetical protein